MEFCIICTTGIDFRKNSVLMQRNNPLNEKILKTLFRVTFRKKRKERSIFQRSIHLLCFVNPYKKSRDYHKKFRKNSIPAPIIAMYTNCTNFIFYYS